MNLEVFFTNAFYLLLILKTTTELFLGLRNRRHLRESYNEVPAELKGSFELTDHQKAIRYHLAKSKLGKWKVQFNTVFLIILLPLGAANWLDNFLYSLISDSIIRGISFFLVLSLVNSILTLPFALYSTFVIEEKYGFNRTTWSLFFTDLLKQLILGAVITLPLLYAVLWFFESFEASWWLYTWIVLTLFQFVLMWLYPAVIAPLFNKFTPLENQELKDDIERLSSEIGFETAGIQVMDASKRSSHGNAYFTGFGKKKKIVFFDTLIEKLENSEILAVLAHEMGHFSKKHIFKFLVISIITSFIGFYILGYISDIPSFYSGHFISNPSHYMALFIFMNIMPLYTFFISPIMSLLSRKHEFEADAFAAEYTQASDLETALIKLHRDNSAILTVDPLYAFFYYSHPPLLQRLKHLKSL